MRVEPADERILHRRTDTARERHEVVTVEDLVPEEHDEVLEPGPADPGDDVVVEIVGEAHAGDLRAERTRDRRHGDPAGGRHVRIIDREGRCGQSRGTLYRRENGLPSLGWTLVPDGGKFGAPRG